ncbi:hypothetical protein [Sphingomonas sp. Y38-1Y]|nr:hypothetical protein [Sphingomonas sp. Y38-1Y]
MIGRDAWMFLAFSKGKWAKAHRQKESRGRIIVAIDACRTAWRARH